MTVVSYVNACFNDVITAEGSKVKESSLVKEKSDEFKTTPTTLQSAPGGGGASFGAGLGTNKEVEDEEEESDDDIL